MLLPSFGIFEKVFANKLSPVMKVTSMQWRSSPMVMHSPPAPMMPLVDSSISGQTKNWPCTRMTTSFVESPAWRSPNQAGFFSPDTMTSTAMSGTPYGQNVQAYWLAMITVWVAWEWRKTVWLSALDLGTVSSRFGIKLEEKNQKRKPIFSFNFYELFKI